MNASSRVCAPRLLLQWHITHRCNRSCSHCYQQGVPCDGPGPAEQEEVLRQFERLMASCSAHVGGPVRGHVTLTGGEPFLHPGFLDLLERIAARPNLSFAILTNGSLIDAALARRLARLRPCFVQLSLDGGPERHDRRRGAGDHEQTTRAARHLVESGVRTLFSFTAGSDNYKDFPRVVRAGCRLGVSRVWADRLVPCGAGAALKTLSPAQTKRFLRLMRRVRLAARLRTFGRTEVAMHRALQFLAGGGPPYRCTAGRSLLTVMPNGDVLPCRRLPIAVGNLLRTELVEIYQDSALLRRLRDPAQVSRGCEACTYRHSCQGGLRCLAHAVHGSPFVADPGCWKSSAIGLAELEHQQEHNETLKTVSRTF